jgi:hypothetical protein
MEFERFVLRPVAVQLDKLAQFHHDVHHLPLGTDWLAQFRRKFRKDVGFHFQWATLKVEPRKGRPQVRSRRAQAPRWEPE